jgi:flagellar basal-body rod protein FlgF
MENTSLIALSRQGTLRRQMNVVAHNIANMNTTGFKGEKMLFIQHLVKSPGGNRISGDQLAFVRDIATVRDISEGPLEKTGNPLDLAVRGEGYFVVETEGGERYSRSGRFHLDEEGQLVTERGHSVLSESGQPFFFSTDDKDISISRDGTVATENGELGRISIVEFENPQNLRVTAGGLYETNEQPNEVDSPDVVQGMLEGSNVEPIIELTRMMEVSRSYQSANKFIEREDERMKKIARELAGSE